MQVQNEIQSMHQHNFQIRNLFFTCVQTQPCACTNSDTPKLIKNLHYYILDDIFHDFLFAQHYCMLH
jgi:hypothetical protein